MIDEDVLQALLRELGDEIPVPPDGPDRVVAAVTTMTAHREAPRVSRGAIVFAAASITVVALLGAVLVHHRTDSNSRVTTAALPEASVEQQSGNLHRASRGETASTAPASGQPTQPPGAGANVGGTTDSTVPTSPSAPVDGAKIVKTASIDLRAPRGGLRLATNRAANVAVGLGGYVAKSTTSFGATQPTADLTVRVPVDSFETALNRLRVIPGMKVVSETESGTDVTAQYTDLQAQLNAATAERDSLLVVLSDARNVGDILAVRDRISSVQAEINQLQGRINVLGDRAAFSSIAVSLSEPAPKAPAAVKPPPPPTGLSKAWHDAKDGFSNSIEWIVARSGGALVVLVAGLALLFGLRLLYPIVRRAFI
jgi:uncharacterized protein DUF4349